MGKDNLFWYCIKCNKVFEKSQPDTHCTHDDFINMKNKQFTDWLLSDKKQLTKEDL